MTLEREFQLAALSHYLDQHPNQAKEQALDFCTKYLEQQEKTIRLQKHCKLMEEKLEEIEIDYQILKMDLELEQQKNLLKDDPQHITPDSNISHSIELPSFLTSACDRYRQP